MFTLSSVLLFLYFTLKVAAQACNAKFPCPSNAPCCSEYGFCGSGSQYCLGGCNPLFSNSLGSCMPNAVCKSQTYTFDKSRILSDAAQFNGNPDTYDWTLDGGDFDVIDNTLVMILTETNAGTRLSSTRYIHYGKISFNLTTGRWPGVVVGAITMSNTRDEIDWEYPGNTTSEAQTNFFWEGINTHGGVQSGLTNTYENFHIYTIDWSADALVFQIDGKTVRTLMASDYVVNGVIQYPTTPSRIQLSLWPAGTNASAAGTVQWAGGMINWQDPDYIAADNQFRTYIQSITVSCTDNPSPDQVSYVYAEGSTANKPIVSLSDQSPIIGSTASTTSIASSSSSSQSTVDSSSTSITTSTSTSTSTPDTTSTTSTSSTTSISTSSLGTPDTSSSSTTQSTSSSSSRNTKETTVTTTGATSGSASSESSTGTPSGAGNNGSGSATGSGSSTSSGSFSSTQPITPSASTGSNSTRTGNVAGGSGPGTATVNELSSAGSVSASSATQSKTATDSSNSNISSSTSSQQQPGGQGPSSSGGPQQSSSGQSSQSQTSASSTSGVTQPTSSKSRAHSVHFGATASTIGFISGLVITFFTTTYF